MRKEVKKLDTSTDSVYSQDSNANEIKTPCYIAEFEGEISATIQKSSVSDRVFSPSYHCSPTISRPNIVACIRSDSEVLGRKILRPINMNAILSKAPLPKILAESDWENELARNILTVFSNKVVGEVRESNEEIKNGCSDLSMKKEEEIEIEYCTDNLQTNDEHCALNTPSQINSQSPAHNESKGHTVSKQCNAN